MLPNDAAKAEAEDVQKRLLAGEPFPRLAAEHSDAASKANGGLIGPIKRDELAEPSISYRQDESGRRGDSAHRADTRIQLESRTDTRIRSFDDARSDISNKVAGEKSGERMKYLERAQATITWRNEELKKAYEQALAERRKVLAG